MLSPDIENAMNTQIAAELYSSHLYLAMSAYCEEQALPGFAHWFRLQSDEEREHALKFLRHVVDRGGRVMLTSVDEPASDFGSPQGAFEQALAHEMNVSMMIDGVVRDGRQTRRLREPGVPAVVRDRTGRGGAHGGRDRADAEDARG